MARKKNKKGFYKCLSIITIMVSIVLSLLIFYINILPFKCFIILIGVFLVLNIVDYLILLKSNSKKKIKKFFSLFSVIYITIGIFFIIYFLKTLGVFFNNSESEYKIENYSVIVLKDKYHELNDLEFLKVGFYSNTKGALTANETLKEKLNINLESYKNITNLVDDLYSSKLSAIVVEGSIKNIIEEEISNFNTKTKTIYNFVIKVKLESSVKNIDVLKNPFVVYISGIDTYGKISSVSRSDVNILTVINPKSKQILLLSVPRDYYVQLHGTTGVKDKLTHAGIYGIDMSIKTIEDLLDIDINYYFKVNFTSLVDIVDALDGVNVYSEYTFTSKNGYFYKSGYNLLNGTKALEFARERYAFKAGDRQRIKNQQAVIDAIIKKALSKSIITKYNELLNSIDGKYQTNMPFNKISSLVKMQLNDMSDWNISSYTLKGKDSQKYTYTYNNLLYVMEPSENSVIEAINQIEKIFLGEKLEEIKYSTKIDDNKDMNNSFNKSEELLNSDENIIEDLEENIKLEEDILKEDEEEIEEKEVLDKQLSENDLVEESTETDINPNDPFSFEES